jgi:hypothetical protein
VPLKLTRVVGVLAYPWAVLAISNTLPTPFVPPTNVVPKRSPWASAIRLPFRNGTVRAVEVDQSRRRRVNYPPGLRAIK